MNYRSLFSIFTHEYSTNKRYLKSKPFTPKKVPECPIAYDHVRLTRGPSVTMYIFVGYTMILRSISKCFFLVESKTYNPLTINLLNSPLVVTIYILEAFANSSSRMICWKT